MWFIIFLSLIVVENLSLNAPLTFTKGWNQFKSQYNKKYLDDVDELNHYNTYIRNRRQVLEHNKLYDLGRVTYKQSINEFSDMEHEDFMKKMTGYNIPSNISFPVRYRREKRQNLLLAESRDWRKYGYVTHVKNQGSECKSCWAFAVTGVLEGQHFKKTGKLVSLSEQNLLDCTTNSNCTTGYVTEAFQYVMRNGINSEKSYPPYKEKKLSCKHNFNENVLKVKEIHRIRSGDEKALQYVSFTYGPISVGIDANLTSFQSYSEGIYDDAQCSSSNLNHAVLLVGYGSERGRDYWIVKNSWGSSWGENGYIRILRNKNNLCGIATYAFVADIYSRVERKNESVNFNLAYP